MKKNGGYAVCVSNRGNPAALEVRKIYRLVEDAAAEKRGLVRVIDESGEDYLYPRRHFVRIDLPRSIVATFAKKSA